MLLKLLLLPLLLPLSTVAVAAAAAAVAATAAAAAASAADAASASAGAVPLLLRGLVAFHVDLVLAQPDQEQRPVLINLVHALLLVHVAVHGGT